MEIKTGICFEKEITVTEDLLASHLGSGLVDVYATPMMILLMEQTSAECVGPYLEEGQVTVGTAIDVSHVAATPLGMKVKCRSELTEVDGRSLTFKVTAEDEAGLIGEGAHKRFIVFAEKFNEKARNKKCI